KHFDKIRSGNGEKRHLGLAGNGARQKRLAGAGRADQKNALGNAAAQALELARIAQELHQLRHFVLGLVAAGHGFERDLDLILALQLAHEVNPQPSQHQHRQLSDQTINQNGSPFGRQRLDFNVVVQQILDQAVVSGRHDTKLLAVAGLAHDDLAAAAFLNFNAAYVAVLNLVEKVRVVHVALLHFRLRVVIEHAHQHNGDDDPHHQVFGKITQN